MAHDTSLNDEQIRALYSNAQDTLVIASPGSGKTRLLIERLFWVFRDGQEKSIVALTFTDKAAQEMRERANRIYQTLPSSEQQLFDSRVVITTIHGYLQRLLLNDVFQSSFLGAQLLDGKEFEFFLRDNIFTFVSQLPSLESAYLEQLDPEQLISMVSLLREAKHLRPHGQTSVINANEQLWLQVKINTEAQIRLCFKNFIWALEEGALKQVLWPFLLNVDTSDGHLLLDMVSQIESHVYRKRLNLECKKYKDSLFEYYSLAQALAVPAVVERQHLLSTLSLLAEQIDLAYLDFKQQNQAFDYTDLEQKMRLCLQDAQNQERMARAIGHLLIDEVQDINPVQHEILESLGRYAQVFKVGDPRQAIYGFRHSQVEIILNMWEHMPPHARFELCANYRSVKEIIDCANHFWQSTHPHHSFKPMLAASFLNVTTPNDSACLGVRLIVLDKNNTDENTQFHPELIDLKESLIPTLLKTYKEKDIAILCRKTKHVEQVSRDLMQSGFMVNATVKCLFSQDLFCKDIITLVDAFLDPEHDEHLWALLRSRFFDVPLSVLLTQFSVFKKQHKETTNRVRAYEFFIKSQAWTPIQLARRALFLQFAQSLSMPLSKRLLGFLKAIHAHDEVAGHADIFKLISNAEALGYAPEAIKKRLLLGETSKQIGQTEGISVLTMHASKGLEWPVVILPFSNQRFVYRGHEKSIALLPQGACSIRGHWPSDGILAAIDSVAQKRFYEEEFRLLYVAITRAQKQLIITSLPGTQKRKSQINEEHSLTDLMHAMGQLPMPDKIN